MEFSTHPNLNNAPNHISHNRSIFNSRSRYGRFFRSSSFGSREFNSHIPFAIHKGFALSAKAFVNRVYSSQEVVLRIWTAMNLIQIAAISYRQCFVRSQAKRPHYAKRHYDDAKDSELLRPSVFTTLPMFDYALAPPHV